MGRTVLLAGLMLTGAAWGQARVKQAATAPAVTYAKTTELTFSDETIEGELTRPDGEYVQARKRSKQPNLLRIREDFRAKVLSTY